MKSFNQENKEYLTIALIEQSIENKNLDSTNTLTPQKEKQILIKSKNIIYCPLNEVEYQYDIISFNQNEVIQKVKEFLYSQLLSMNNTSILVSGNSENKSIIYNGIISTFAMDIFNSNKFSITINNYQIINYNDFISYLNNNPLKQISFSLLSKEKSVDDNNLNNYLNFDFNLILNENDSSINTKYGGIMINCINEKDINSLISSLDYIDMMKIVLTKNKNINKNIPTLSSFDKNNPNNFYSNYMTPNSERELFNEPIKNYHYQNKHIRKNINDDNFNNYQNPRDQSINSVPTNLNNNNMSQFDYENNKINELNRTMNQQRNPNLDISKTLEKMYSNNYNNINDKKIFNDDSITKQMLIEIERLKNENTILLSDNIIFKEDINRLKDINIHLENELNDQRNRNYDLANENDKINRENQTLAKQIDVTNNKINQINLNDNNLMENINNRIMFEDKIRQNEYDLKNLKEINANNEIEHLRLIEDYNKLKGKNENNIRQLEILQKTQEDEISVIEERLSQILLEIDNLKNENYILRNDNKNLRSDLEKNQILKDNLFENYNEQKGKNESLRNEINVIKNDFEKYKKDLLNEEIRRKKEEEERRMKLENKARIMSDMQRRIQIYRDSKIKKKQPVSE